MNILVYQEIFGEKVKQRICPQSERPPSQLFMELSNFFGNINLPVGVIGHEGSTILVIISGLRLLR